MLCKQVKIGERNVYIFYGGKEIRLNVFIPPNKNIAGKVPFGH